MGLQSSGSISLAQVATEFGGDAPHSLSEYRGKGNAPVSGAVQLGADFYGTANEYQMQMMAVGGGGGSNGGGPGVYGAGAAGGVLRTATKTVVGGTTITVVVAAGVPQFTDGESSTIDGTDTSGAFNITATGGGGRPNSATRYGANNADYSGAYFASGGDAGGGAGAGGNASGITGGPGATNTLLDGTTIYYGGGGGGGSYGSGGSGGGGSAYQNGGVNTGGGAGGACCGGGRSGGSGVVILRLPTGNYSGTTTGSPIVTTDGSDTVLKFTQSGTYTV